MIKKKHFVSKSSDVPYIRSTYVRPKRYKGTAVSHHLLTVIFSAVDLFFLLDPSPQLWRLLLRRAQEVLGRGGSAAGEDPSTTTAREEETAAAGSLLSRGMIPLPLLDDVMGFDADEALRARRQLQQQEAVSVLLCGEFKVVRACRAGRDG